jgi:carboxypeptidase family protein
VRARAGLFIIATVGFACASRPRVAPAPTTGEIIGLVRDRATGERIALAQLRLRGDAELVAHAAKSDPEGTYGFTRLRPGRYALTAYFAGDVVEVTNIEVSAGHATPVDIAFELGRVEPLHVDFGDPSAGAIDRYRPRHTTPGKGTIEGTVTDAATRERVTGAVITAIGPRMATTHQTVSDGQGRFVFADLAPGAYSVNAYYAIARRGQIEVLRNGLEVKEGEAVVVPLWIELEGN